MGTEFGTMLTAISGNSVVIGLVVFGMVMALLETIKK